MKRIFIFLILVVIIILTSTSLYDFPKSSDTKEQSIISKEYQNKSGLVKNYGRNENVEFLSESIGQYMRYLLIVEDKDQFNDQVKYLKDYFLVQNNKSVFVKWQITDDTTTNASVDDLRIIGALYEGSKLFEEPDYFKLAENLEQSLLEKQMKNGIVVDFYDWKSRAQSSTIHMSYIDYEALRKSPLVDKAFYKQLIEESATNTPFFNEIYDVTKEEYQASDLNTVNMIDQILIAIQYHEITGRVPANFDKWIKSELNARGKLYGGYHKNNHSPAVDFESSSAYALGVMYSLATGDDPFAKQLHELMLKQPPFENNPDYSNIHFFDYIYSKTANALYKRSLK